MRNATDIHREIAERFDALVKANSKIYLSKDPGIRQHLIAYKIKTRLKNKGIEPYISFEPHKCLTCGTINKAHPDTSFCFVCDTDNWQRIK